MLRAGDLKLWDDSQIRPGKKWKEEIGRALESAKVALMLVSDAFLASDFVVSKELPPLFQPCPALHPMPPHPQPGENGGSVTRHGRKAVVA